MKVEAIEVGTHCYREIGEDAVSQAWRVLVVDPLNEITSFINELQRGYTSGAVNLVVERAESHAEVLRQLTESSDIAVIILELSNTKDDSALILIQNIREVLGNIVVSIITVSSDTIAVEYGNFARQYNILSNITLEQIKSGTARATIVEGFKVFQSKFHLEESRQLFVASLKQEEEMSKFSSLSIFISGFLSRLCSLLSDANPNCRSEISMLSAYRIGISSEYRVLEGMGEYKDSKNIELNQVLSEEDCQHAFANNETTNHSVTRNSYCGIFTTHSGESALIYVKKSKPLNERELQLLSQFTESASTAIGTISISNDDTARRSDVLTTLSRVVELRSQETAVHVNRVGAVSKLLASRLGLSSREIDLVWLAAPLHDIGKAVTPESILNKQGTLTKHEYSIMQNHVTHGYEFLKNSNIELINAAATIALSHHEKWDGTGYPRGLKGDDIHIFGRIVGLADVVDALIGKRCYKDPLSLGKVVDIVHSERGKHFDPAVVDTFVNSLDEYVEILRQFPN